MPGRDLPPVEGPGLRTALTKLRTEPVRSPDWQPITLRAFVIGGLLLAAWLWPPDWRGALTYVRDVLLALAGYLLHANVIRIRDPRLWKAKPGSEQQ